MLAFLGVELGRKEVSFFNGGTEILLSVLASCGDEFHGNLNGIEGVNEVKIGIVFKTLPLGRLRVFEIDRIPTHVRDFDLGAGKAFDGAWDNAEAGSAMGFFACFEKKLITHADAEVGLIGSDPFTKWLRESKTVQAFHAISESALAWENEVGKIDKFLWLGDKNRIMSKAAAGINHAAEISPTVVDHSEFHGALKNLLGGRDAFAARVVFGSNAQGDGH